MSTCPTIGLPAGAAEGGAFDDRTGETLQTTCSYRSLPAGESPTVSVPETLLNHLLETEAMYLSADQLRAVTIKDILSVLDAYKVAKFIHAELPKRLAIRIRMIDNLVEWCKVPELVKVRTDMQRWFRIMRLVRRGPDVGLEGFLECAKTVRHEGKDVVVDTTVGMHKLLTLTGNAYSAEFVNKWLDDFFLIRIGSNLLVDQCVALAKKSEGGSEIPTGIVDMACDITKVCEQAAEYARMLTEMYTGFSPVYTIEAVVLGKEGTQVGEPHMISHVPAYLRYILVELLKNSFKATVVNSRDKDDLEKRPVRILVSSDAHHIAVRVRDAAGGIPYEMHGRLWSYLYGRAAARRDCPEEATPLAGYGVGLPLARLHAKYLGGTLHLATFPGYGTDVSLHLPVLHSEQVVDSSFETGIYCSPARLKRKKNHPCLFPGFRPQGVS